MSFPDRRTLHVLLTALLFAVTLAIVYVARTVIVIFAFSILFAYLINPIVRFLQRRLCGRAVYSFVERPSRRRSRVQVGAWSDPQNPHYTSRLSPCLGDGG